MSTEITARVAAELLTHEGVVRQMYFDSVGVATWGVGVTSRSGHKVERYKDNPQTLERCLEVYIWLLKTKYAPAVRKTFKGYDLTEAQFAAALSFHYNTGAIARAAWVSSFKLGDMAKARKQIMNWRTPAEVTKRRKAERNLFFDGSWSSDGTMTEYTQLTSRGTPKWSSAKRTPVFATLAAMLEPPAPVEPPVTPKPPTKPTVAAPPAKPEPPLNDEPPSGIPINGKKVNVDYSPTPVEPPVEPPVSFWVRFFRALGF